jgi:hypothetical protein
MRLFSTTWGSIVAAGLFLALSFLVIPATMVLIDEAADAGVASILLAAVGALLFGLIFLVARAKVNQPRAKLIVLVLSFVFFILHMLPLLVLDSTPVKSDFLTYWQEANALANGSNDFPVRSVYERRTLPFLFPLASVFGERHAVYQAFNLILLTGMYFLISSFCRVRYGPGVGIATALFLLAIPELYGVIFYSHHDFYGAALLVLCFALLWRMEMDGSYQSRFIFSLLLGLTMFLFWLQRGLHMPAFAALIVCLVISTRSPPEPGKVGAQLRSWTFVLLIPIFVFQGCMWLSKTTGLSDPASQRTDLSFAVYGNVESRGGYAFGAGSPVFNTLTEAEKKSFGLEIISRDFLENPGKYLWSRYEKATRMFEFGSNIWFYAPPSKSKTIYHAYSFASVTFRLWLNFVIVILSVWAGVKLLRAVMMIQVTYKRSALWAGFMVTMLVFSFSMFFETTSRHMIPAYFLLPLFFGGLVTSRELKNTRIANLSHGKASYVVSGLALVLLTSFSFIQARQFFLQRFSLVDWRSASIEERNIASEVNEAESRFSNVPKETKRFLWKKASPNVFGKYDYFVLPKDPTKPAELSLNVCSDPNLEENPLTGLIESIPWEDSASNGALCLAIVEGAHSECRNRIQRVTIDDVNRENCRIEFTFPASEKIGGWRLALFSYAKGSDDSNSEKR